MTGDAKDTDTRTDDPGTIEEGTESVRRTIVGGRPLDRRRRKVRIPIGIEKVLCAAAADREFREQLLMARADALAGTGLEVSGAEAMILKSVSEGALRTMIENIDLKRHRRRRFFRGIAAASLAATTAMVSINCDSSTGDGADWPPGADTTEGRSSDVGDIEFEDHFMDVGVDVVEPAPEIVDVDQVSFDVGVTDGPPEIIDVQDELTDLGATDGEPEELPSPEDIAELDVDIQPMPAGIPPMEDVKEPK